MRVGIIGGGQLGMMLAEALKKYAAYVIALDPNPLCSCKYVCDEIIVSEYNDLANLKKLADRVDVITYEFENVNAKALIYLNENYNLPQGIRPLFDSQNRIREKENAIKNGLSPVEFYKILNEDDLLKGISEIGYPCVYKTTTLGYDGHGQVVLRSDKDLPLVSKYLGGEGILEKYLKYDYEASVILVRDNKEIVAFPPSYNIHKDGILDLTVAGFLDDLISEKLINKSKAFMNSCNYYGILAIEYFVKDGEIYFNEMAPRPHNSGHYTIEGCNISQYEELARFLLKLPLIEPKLVSKTVMKNVLGEDLENKCPFGFWHDYYKKESRPKRKMGHITFTNTSLDDYNQKYKKYFI